MNRQHKSNIFVCFSAIALILSLVYGIGHFRNEQKSVSAAEVEVVNVRYEFNAEVGNKHEVILKVKNRGGEDLIISNISPSCGCIVTEKKTITVLPGSESRLPVSFWETKGEGIQRYRILAETNDPKSPILKFDVTANIKNKLLVKFKKGAIYQYKDEDVSDHVTIKFAKEESEILSYKLSSDQDWFQVDSQLHENQIDATIKYRDGVDHPYGGFSIHLKVEVLRNGEIVKRTIPYFVSREGLYTTQREFAVGQYTANGESDLHAILEGPPLENYMVEYSGSNLFNSKVHVEKGNEIFIKLSPLKEELGYTEKGHILIKDKVTRRVVFSLPTIIDVFRGR